MVDWVSSETRCLVFLGFFLDPWEAASFETREALGTDLATFSKLSGTVDNFEVPCPRFLTMMINKNKNDIHAIRSGSFQANYFFRNMEYLLKQQIEGALGNWGEDIH